MKEIIHTAFIVDENTLFTLTEVRERFAIEEKFMAEMIEHGLIEPKKIPEQNDLMLDQTALQRVQTALHLYYDLGVNVAGTALVLEMLSELDAARHELTVLHHHLR